MFSNLVESNSKAVRRPGRGGTVWSFVAHYGLILAAVYTSAQAETVDERPVVEKIGYVEPAKQPEVRKEPPPPELVVAPRPTGLKTLLIAPVEIPNALPEIDLRARITDPDEFVRRGSPGTDTAGTVDASTEPARDYFISQVEKPVMQAPNSAVPSYPDLLRQAGVEGEALVSFVVDTTGRVDVASFKVVRSTHDLFATAVRNALPRMRFIPAEIGERKVRQVVQQPFSFAIVK